MRGGELTPRGRAVAEQCMREVYAACRIVFANLETVRGLHAEAQAAEPPVAEEVRDQDGFAARRRELRRMLRSGRIGLREYERQLIALRNRLRLTQDRASRESRRFAQAVEDRFGYRV